MIWHVAPIVVRENGRLVVDDVIYLKDATLNLKADWRLSQSLSNGCDGPRWVGDREQPDQSKQKSSRLTTSAFQTGGTVVRAA